MITKILAAMLALFAAAAFAAVDANKATQAELEAVKGIGPAISAKIVEERSKGAFKDWQDMVTRVKGVGEHNAAKFSTEGLTVNGAAFTGAPAKAAAPAGAKKEEKKAAAPAATAASAAKAADTSAADKKAAAQKANEDKKAAKAAAADEAKKAKADKAAAAKAEKTAKDTKPAAAAAASAARRRSKTARPAGRIARATPRRPARAGRPAFGGGRSRRPVKAMFRAASRRNTSVRVCCNSAAPEPSGETHEHRQDSRRHPACPPVRRRLRCGRHQQGQPGRARSHQGYRPVDVGQDPRCAQDRCVQGLDRSAIARQGRARRQLGQVLADGLTVNGAAFSATAVADAKTRPAKAAKAEKPNKADGAKK
jgi:competence protein ComEA